MYNLQDFTTLQCKDFLESFNKSFGQLSSTPVQCHMLWLLWLATIKVTSATCQLFISASHRWWSHRSLWPDVHKLNTWIETMKMQSWSILFSVLVIKLCEYVPLADWGSIYDQESDVHVWKTFGTVQVDLFTEAKSTHCKLWLTLVEPNSLLSQDMLAHDWSYHLLQDLVSHCFIGTLWWFLHFTGPLNLMTRIRILISTTNNEQKSLWPTCVKKSSMRQRNCCSCNESTVPTFLRIAEYTSAISMYCRNNRHNISAAVKLIKEVKHIMQ